MIYKTGEQDKYNYIFPRPKNDEFVEDKSYTLKCNYTDGDLLTFYNETKNGNDDITITKDLMLERDEYTLKADGNGIVITASCDDGVFRALTSLRQLIKKGNGGVMYCDVHDKPVFKQRGYMWDISRKRKPRVEYILKIVDMLAELKYNEFHLYMEDFCFKFEAFPQFTADFDCLTAEDIRYIDAYCKERFIELVPDLNGMGHMTAWLATDEFKHLAVTNETMNFLDPEALDLMDKIYGSLLPNFSSKRVHIGLDEALGLGKGQTEEECNKKGKATVFMEWLNKLADLCENKYGKTVMFWDDMIIHHPESLPLMPKNAIPVEWGYETIFSQFIPENCAALEKMVDKYYVAPSDCTCLAITNRWDVTENNIRTMAEMGEKHNAYGYLLTHWGDPDHPHNQVWGYLQICLAGQYCWNPGWPQQGGWRKNYFVYNAEDFLDEFMFGGEKVARWLRYLGNYFLLEPERLAVSTVCANCLYMPVADTVKTDFFEVDSFGGRWHLDNVIRYMSDGIAEVEKLDFDDIHKREIIVNCKMVIAGAKIYIAKVEGGFTKEESEEMVKLLEWIIKEHTELWLIRDYEKGIEAFLEVLNTRLSEVKTFTKE